MSELAKKYGIGEREIKFRAFVIYKNKIEEVFSMTCGISGNYSRGLMKDEDPYLKFGRGAILMQYTGLKDKNGKEVYEGDIVNGTHTFIMKNLVVRYSDEYVTYLVDYYDGFHGKCIYIHDLYELEVIGNIFENPELLNT